MFLHRPSQAARVDANPLRARAVEPTIQSQWLNPSDILSVLLIIGGSILQKAIAQLSGGYLVPIAFSFGWVAYSFEALMSAVGDNSLMPSPDCPAIVINAKSGMSRPNRSWILGRIVRDFEKPIESSLRVTVFRMEKGAGNPSIDYIWISGVVTILAQLGIALIPWILYRDWAIFLVTAGGTALALINCALPQWKMEKWGCRIDSKKKTISLTRGNGSQHVMVIFGIDGGYDLEDLAGGRHKDSPYTRMVTALLAFLWLGVLMTVAGIKQDSWYMLAVGSIGMIQNVVAAGAPRDASAFDIHLERVEEIEASNVMQTLMDTETSYPTVGASLVPVFFPAGLRADEEIWWAASKAKVSEKKAAEKATSRETQEIQEIHEK